MSGEHDCLNDDERDLPEMNSELPAEYYNTWGNPDFYSFEQDAKNDWACWSFGVAYRRSQFGFLKELQTAYRQDNRGSGSDSATSTAAPVPTVRPDRFWHHLFHDLSLARELARFMPHSWDDEQQEFCPVILQPSSTDRDEEQKLLRNEWRDTPSLAVYEKDMETERPGYYNADFQEALVARDSRRLFLVPQPGNKYLETIFYFLRAVGANRLTHLVYGMPALSPQLLGRLLIEKVTNVIEDAPFHESSIHYITCPPCRDDFSLYVLEAPGISFLTSSLLT